MKKVEDKLASQPQETVLLQKFDSEIGELALNCLKNASIKENIIGALNNVENFVTKTPAGIAGASGLGGAALGSLIGGQTSSKGEFETDEDYKRRHSNSVLAGALAGGAAGLGAPSIVSALSNIPGGADEGIIQRLKSLILNPSTVTAGAGAGAGIWGLNKHLDKLNLRREVFAKANDTPFVEATGKDPISNNLKKYLKGLEELWKTKSFQNRNPFEWSKGLPGDQWVKIPPSTTFKVTKFIFKNLIKKKFAVPIAAGAAALGVGEVMGGQDFFNKTVFDK